MIPHLWTPDTTVILGPGVWDEMPDSVYHRDIVRGGSLSHSGLRTILDVPARFKWERDNGGRPNKRAFDLGHLVHGKVLGTGAVVRVLDYTGYTTNAAKAERDEAYAAGEVPVLAKEDRTADAMAAALRRHHVAGGLFRPERGHAERSVFWHDDEFGIWRRARYDWSMILPDGRFAIVDYKTVGKGTVSPRSIARKLYDFGYYTQDVYYCDGAQAVGLGEDPVFLFVYQETTPPYLVTVSTVHQDARHWARLKIREGLARYADCMASDTWPDYAADVVEVGLPKYAEYDLADQWAAGTMAVDS